MYPAKDVIKYLKATVFLGMRSYDPNPEQDG
jgi:hypothetical protein